MISGRGWFPGGHSFQEGMECGTWSLGEWSMEGHGFLGIVFRRVWLLGVVYERAWFPGGSSLCVLVIWGVAYGRAWPLGRGFQEGVDYRGLVIHWVWSMGKHGLLGVVSRRVWSIEIGYLEGVACERAWPPGHGSRRAWSTRPIHLGVSMGGRVFQEDVSYGAWSFGVWSIRGRGLPWAWFPRRRGLWGLVIWRVWSMRRCGLLGVVSRRVWL